jgi:hypothetical protein
VNGIGVWRTWAVAIPDSRSITWPSIPRISFGPALEKLWKRLTPADSNEMLTSGAPALVPKMLAGLPFSSFSEIGSVTAVRGLLSMTMPGLAVPLRLAVKLVPLIDGVTADVVSSATVTLPSPGLGSVAVRVNVPPKSSVPESDAEKSPKLTEALSGAGNPPSIVSAIVPFGTKNGVTAPLVVRPMEALTFAVMVISRLGTWTPAVVVSPSMTTPNCSACSPKSSLIAFVVVPFVRSASISTSRLPAPPPAPR